MSQAVVRTSGFKFNSQSDNPNAAASALTFARRPLLRSSAQVLFSDVTLQVLTNKRLGSGAAGAGANGGTAC